jgi:hypothetical protein
MATTTTPNDPGLNTGQQQHPQQVPVADNNSNSNNGAPSIQRVCANENQAITCTDNHLDDTNWTVWCHRLMLMLQICGVQGYTLGTVQHPDPSQDPEGANNWDFNNTYARVLMTTWHCCYSRCRGCHCCSLAHLVC